MKKATKLLALLLAVVLVLSCFAGCKPKDPVDESGNTEKEKAEYTYRDYTVKLGVNWNPHTWETAYDNAIMEYLVTPLVTQAVKDSDEGAFQWVYKAAASITDVTADHKDDLTKYKVTLPAGQSAEQTQAGYVFEIALNPNMKWQDGTAINADSYIYSMKALLDPAMKNYRANLYFDGESAVAGGNSYYNGGNDKNYDETVGCYKVDDYTIRYVTQSQIDINNFLTACTSNWLVYKDLYENGKDTSGTLVTTNYGTSMETTMSYGPYKLTSLQDGKQAVFAQNENYYQYVKQEDGTLYAETDYEVDGEKVRAYQTTKIVIDVMTDEAAAQAFLKGELSRWTPTADEMSYYSTSEQIHWIDETYTYSLFFNTDVNALKEMDRSKGNQNSVVLSNHNFRQAISLAVDRKDWVTATPGYKPSITLMNDQYFYDVYNDPKSTYRGTDAGMKVITTMYGVDYGNGKTYANLTEAYESVTGYNLSEAKGLMGQACNELVAAGLYTRGEEIKIRIAYSDGPLDSSNHSQIAKLNQYLNAAVEGSGFGKITLEAIGDIPSRQEKVPAGEYAIGYGAWGGAAFYPFRNMQLYCDTEKNKINELGCWNPASETLTIEINGGDVTKTWQDWSRALIGTGPYANATAGVKLDITATMEREFLEKYYRIPLAASCDAFLQSFQVQNYTDEYNIMYGFGGMELMTYNYSDAEWAAYVEKSGGKLSYE